MNIGKIVLGLIVLIVGLWLLIPTAVCGNIIWCPGLWVDLWLVIKGTVPLALVLLGVMLIWMEAE